MTEKISYCRNCAANCGIVLNVENNTIQSIKGDRKHPLTEGYVCIKGTMAAHLHNGNENRLMHCMKKGDDGRFHAIDKYQAADEIAEQLKSIVDRHGPRALGLYFGTYSYFDCVSKTLLKDVMSQLGSPSIFSSMTIDQSSKWVTAARMGVWANGKPPSTETDVILIAGCNPPVSHQGYPMVPYPTTNTSGYIREAKKRGVKLIVIDPRKTEMARRADLFIQCKPGYDAAIFAAMIRQILTNNWHDELFCKDWTQNLERLRKAVEPFTLERVCSAADINPDDITQAVRWLVDAKKPGLGTGTGVDMARFSNTAEHLFEALTGLVGGYVRAGDKIPNPGVFFARPEVETVYPPNRSWEQAPQCASDKSFGKLMGEFPSSLLPDEITHKGKDKLRALIVVGGNPLQALGEPERVSEAFEQLDLLVVFDPRLNSATAQKADYVMSPPLQFERDEVTSFTEFAFHTPFAQYTEKVKNPPPGVLGEDEFAWILAKKFNLDLRFKYLPFGADYKDVPGGIDVDMTHPPDREQLIAWMCDNSKIPFEQLKNNPHGCVLTQDKKLGRALNDDGARLDLCPADVFDEVDNVYRSLNTQPATLLLTARRFVESYNSSFLSHPITEKRLGLNHLHIHPDDMQAHGLNEADAIKVSSKAGELTTYVKKDPSMKPGVVSMSHCWGLAADQLAQDPNGLKGAQTGFLVSLQDKLQSINRMPLQTGIPIELSKLDHTLSSVNQ